MANLHITKALMIAYVLLMTSLPFGSATCKPSGHLHGKSGHCNKENDSECCVSGKKYLQFKCSPPVSKRTKAHMTINSFAEGGDGGGVSECDQKFHKDSEMVVALSSGWFNKGSRCLKNIKIHANGKSVVAKVVDECDSVHGCDAQHDFQPPCPNNVVDASPAVWKALGIKGSRVGDFAVTWSDV